MNSELVFASAVLLVEGHGEKLLFDYLLERIKAALARQAELNKVLKPWDAFVLASGLEVLLIETVGQKGLAEMLGPQVRSFSIVPRLTGSPTEVRALAPLIGAAYGQQ